MASSDRKSNVISENKIKVVLFKKIIFAKLLTDRIMQGFRSGLQYSEKFRITQEINQGVLWYYSRISNNS